MALIQEARGFPIVHAPATVRCRISSSIVEKSLLHKQHIVQQMRHVLFEHHNLLPSRKHILLILMLNSVGGLWMDGTCFNEREMALLHSLSCF